MPFQIKHRFQPFTSSEYRKKQEILENFKKSHKPDETTGQEKRFLDQASFDKIKHFYTKISTCNSDSDFEQTYHAFHDSLPEKARLFLVSQEDLKLVLNHRYSRLDYFFGQNHSPTKTMQAILAELEKCVPENLHTVSKKEDIKGLLGFTNQLGPAQVIFSFLDQNSLKAFAATSRQALSAYQIFFKLQFPFEKRLIKIVSKDIFQPIVRNSKLYFLDKKLGSICISDPEDPANFTAWMKIENVDKLAFFDVIKGGSCVILIFKSKSSDVMMNRYQMIFQAEEREKIAEHSVDISRKYHNCFFHVTEQTKCIRIILGPFILLFDKDTFKCIKNDTLHDWPTIHIRDIIDLPEQATAIARYYSNIIILNTDQTTRETIADSSGSYRLAVLPNGNLVSGHEFSTALRIWKKTTPQDGQTSYQCIKTIELDFKPNPKSGIYDKINQIDVTSDGKVVVTLYRMRYDPYLKPFFRKPPAGVTTTIILDPDLAPGQEQIRTIHTNASEIVVTDDEIVAFTS